MISELAPILVFAYKRLDTLQRTIEALKRCALADQCELFIFSDGYKSETDKSDVIKVRSYLETINGFKTCQVYYSEANKGLAQSIIDGVTEIFQAHDGVIVLEDDIVTSSNFIQFMNQNLTTYKENSSVFSISGYNYPFKIKENEISDVYLLPRISSWGWATWKDRWQNVDWAIKDFDSFSKNKAEIREFNKGGSDLFRMLIKQQNGRIESWDIWYAYNQYRLGGYTIYPMVSKVQNIGFNAVATNTNSFNRYFSKMDNGVKNKFILPEIIEIDPFYHRQLLKIFSFPNRIKGRIMTYLYRLGMMKNK